ncbi:MAG: NAD(P)H-dependent oxidoreductase [Parachlamydiales bacterium]|jgi:NAD(P)H-dependent FMN reductase
MANRRPKILAFAGSLRKDSVNKKLIQVAQKGAKDAGADVTLIDLKDFPLPIYDGDIEDKNGQPAEAVRLKKLMMEHDGFLIASPEYNSSISAVLKNAFDWVSRPVPNEEYLIAFKNKVAGLLTASPSYMGGIRGLVHLRSILGNVGTLVLPDQFTIANAYEAFDENGNLKDTKKRDHALKIAADLANIIAKLQAEQLAVR